MTNGGRRRHCASRGQASDRGRGAERARQHFCRRPTTNAWLKSAVPLASPRAPRKGSAVAGDDEVTSNHSTRPEGGLPLTGCAGGIWSADHDLQPISPVGATAHLAATFRADGRPWPHSAGAFHRRHPRKGPPLRPGPAYGPPRCKRWLDDDMSSLHKRIRHVGLMAAAKMEIRASGSS